VSFNDGNGYDDYDVSDEIWFGADSPSVETSLSTSAVDKDYGSGVALEVSSDSIFYYYMFDEAINVSRVSEDYPLEIKFFGKDLKITGAGWTGADSDKITVKVGETFYMSIGDEVTMDGHKVKLEDVGDAKVAISVDGGEIVTIDEEASHSWAEGLEVNADSVFYKSGDPTQSTANLIMGEDATKTYIDNDAFVGEDEDNDRWRWDIADLDATVTTTTVTSAGTATGPTLALKNYFVVDDASDTDPEPIVNSGCYDMATKDPYAQICVDGLTVADDDYAKIDVDLATVDLRDAGGMFGALSSASVLRITSSESDSLRVDVTSSTIFDGFYSASLTADPETDTIYLYLNDSNATAPRGAVSQLFEVFYVDNDNDVAYAGGMVDPAETTELNSSFAYMDFGDTRASDVVFYMSKGCSGTGAIDWCMNITSESTELPGSGTTDSTANISIAFTNSTNYTIDAIGVAANTEAAEDMWYRNPLTAAGMMIGTQDEDLRTEYGIIIKDPESNCADDQVSLMIPGDAVRAKVTIGAFGAIGAAIVDEATTPDEITSVTEGSILVGGPAANKWAADAMGKTFPTYGTDLGWSDGYCYIKEASLSGKAVTVVAGWDAADTDACVDKYVEGVRSHDGVLA
jgi:hypothetical protein